MKRKAFNPPNDWGANFEMNQVEGISQFSEVVHFSGQTALYADEKSEMGLSVMDPGDMAGQMRFILDVIDQHLSRANMSKANIVNLRFYTTDMTAFLENYGIYSGWIRQAGIRPPQTAIGVNQLVMPDMVLEIEITAAR